MSRNSFESAASSESTEGLGIELNVGKCDTGPRITRQWPISWYIRIRIVVIDIRGRQLGPAGYDNAALIYILKTKDAVAHGRIFW